MAVTLETIRVELEEGLRDLEAQRPVVEVFVRRYGVESRVVVEYICHLLQHFGYSLKLSYSDWKQIVERCYLECRRRNCESDQQEHKDLILRYLHKSITSDRYPSLGLFHNYRKVELGDLIPLTPEEQRRCAESLVRGLPPYTNKELRDQVFEDYLKLIQSHDDLLYLSPHIIHFVPDVMKEVEFQFRCASSFIKARTEIVV